MKIVKIVNEMQNEYASIFCKVVNYCLEGLLVGELCVEGVHAGSDRTSRSVAQNQVPIDTNQKFNLEGSPVCSH